MNKRRSLSLSLSLSLSFSLRHVVILSEERKERRQEAAHVFSAAVAAFVVSAHRADHPRRKSFSGGEKRGRKDGWLLWIMKRRGILQAFVYMQ